MCVSIPGFCYFMIVQTMIHRGNVGAQWGFKYKEYVEKCSICDMTIKLFCYKKGLNVKHINIWRNF